MRLDREEIQDLAGYLARRFPDSGTRHRLAMRAAVSFADDHHALSGWIALLIAAQDRRRLADLAAAIAGEDRADTRLQEICRLLTPPPAPRWPLALGAAAAGVAAALLVWAWPAGPLALPADPPPAPTPLLEDAADAVVAAASLPAPAALPPAPPVPEEPAPAAEAPAPAPEPVPAPAAVLASAEAMPPEPSAPKPAPKGNYGCKGEPGQLIGYWYAGERSPGEAGDLVTLPSAVTVRADYPQASTGFRVRGARCTLPAGAQVRLSADPLLIPGDRYWVPLKGGDL